MLRCSSTFMNGLLDTDDEMSSLRKQQLEMIWDLFIRNVFGFL